LRLYPADLGIWLETSQKNLFAEIVEFQLRRIMGITFVVDDAAADQIGERNRLADAWANVSLEAQALRGRNDPGMLGPYEAAFASPDGRHRVRVRLPAVRRHVPGDGYQELFAAPAESAISIQYVGSLRFLQYDTARQRLRQVRPP
jgi:hypothetical protein